MEEKENIVLYDWLSFTSKNHTPEQLIEALGLTHCPWQETKGAHGYRDRKYFSCISVHYEQYDGQMIWDKDRAMWVEQRVKVLSNVALSIPYEDFVSLQQVVYCAEKNGQYDKEHDTLTVTLVLGDEFSVQMNSRNFKSNIDPLFLNTLLTCRHYHISMYYTAQRFGHVDALLRQVTSCVVDCDKLWRFQRQNLYDAWEMENATNTQLLTPLTRRCWFVTNRDYAAYDTLACVGNLQKSFKEGDMLSEEEILSLRRNEQQANMDGVVKPSRKWRRNQKKMYK